MPRYGRQTGSGAFLSFCCALRSREREGGKKKDTVADCNYERKKQRKKERAGARWATSGCRGGTRGGQLTRHQPTAASRHCAPWRVKRGEEGGRERRRNGRLFKPCHRPTSCTEYLPVPSTNYELLFVPNSYTPHVSQCLHESPNSRGSNHYLGHQGLGPNPVYGYSPSTRPLPTTPHAVAAHSPADVHPCPLS